VEVEVRTLKKPVQFGKYLLLDRINVGGMAEVFKAKAFGVEGFERLVAVKRILPNIAEDEEFITMFIDEAKIAVQLSHANIAQIFDLGKADEAFFIALEFIQGKDLRAIYDRCKQAPVDGSPAMPLAQACFIIMKACEGLDYAHNKKDQGGSELHLVHRDVSPQNILISYEGEVKLIDFGIAKAAGKASKTQQGILKGKFGYMSPEQVRGLPLDRRSDIFSVGICLYEMLTAERLFVGESDFSTLEKVRNVEILPPSTYNRRIPEELERIVLKALAKDVEDRYQNAIDLHDDLQAFMYTAGEFYARKDLGAWMKRVYDDEIKSEQQKLESYQRLPAIITPAPTSSNDRARRPSGGMPVAPPPPPAQAMSQRPSQQLQAVSPSGAPPLLSRPPEPALEGHTADAKKPPRNGKHANGHANGHADSNGAHAADLNWDDEELATNIYDEGESADDSIVSDMPVRPDLSRVPLSADGAPVPASPRAPTPSRGVPEAMPTKLTSKPPGSGLGDLDASISGTDMRAHRRRTEGPPIMLLVGIGAVVLAAFAVVSGYLYLGSRPGQIQITSEPAGGVQILVNNERVPVDGTPTIISRPPGSYSLLVQHEGYVPYSEQIELKSREVLKKHVPLEPLTSGTGFKLAEPIGAQVYLDGKLLEGQTPLQVQSVMPGKHKVEVRGPYGAWIEDITLDAGKMTELHPVFPNAPGITAPIAPSRPELTTRQDPPHDVLEPVRRNPGSPVAEREPASDPVPPRERTPRTGGKHRLAETQEDPEPAPVAARNPDRAPDRNAERPAAGGEGYLRINSKPWTNISIDGKDTGMHTPQTHIKLSAGSHRVLLANPALGARESFTVEIGAGATETIVKDLRPKDSQGDND